MSFFPAEPDRRPAPPEDDPPEQRWRSSPTDEVPAVLPVSAVLVVDRHVAVLLRGVRVFSDGLELDVEARLRRADASDDRWDDLVERFGEFGHRHRRRDVGRVRVGVILADGRPVIGEGADPDSTGDAGEPAYRLTRQGGHGTGSDRHHETAWTLWLWPLPPDGPLTLVMDWAEFGFAETRFVIDAGGLAAIAASTARIWPDGGAPTGPAQPTWTIPFRSSGA